MESLAVILKTESLKTVFLQHVRTGCEHFMDVKDQTLFIYFGSRILDLDNSDISISTHRKWVFFFGKCLLLNTAFSSRPTNTGK